MKPRKLILKNHLSPGDIVMLTAAVRDLHIQHPGKFLTDVRSTAKGLWKHNPYLTQLNPNDEGIELLDCHYPLIHQSNQRPYHFIHGFHQYLTEKLGVPVTPTEFKGDVHLSLSEKSEISQVTDLTGDDSPFWIIVAGGKRDYTIKWWDPVRYQRVVDHFNGKIRFVQVGESGHHHPALEGVVDLRGKTTIRQLIRLVYHSQGVLCPVTFLMHLAAAVETKPGMSKSRPCVVVAGGREGSHWEAYPHHRFLHTHGLLRCCEVGGCWKARTIPIGDGDPKDNPENLCVDVVDSLPRCMSMISHDDVAREIDAYFKGGVVKYLTKGEGKTEVTTLLQRTKRQRPKNRNQLAIRFLGLRRSGIHPVINWVVANHRGKTCFINDLNHQGEINSAHQSDLLPVLEDYPERAVSLAEKKDLLVVGFEDERLLALKNNPLCGEMMGYSKKAIDILLLRDPFNTFASRLHLMRSRSQNPFVKRFLNPIPGSDISLPELWKRYAHEFLGNTNHLKNRKLVINFNQWAADEEYRRGICEWLGVDFSDDYKNRVPAYGFGSSFDGQSFDGKSSEMDVSTRWKNFEEDDEFVKLFADPEIIELAEIIFPQVPVPECLLLKTAS